MDIQVEADRVVSLVESGQRLAIELAQGDLEKLELLQMLASLDVDVLSWLATDVVDAWSAAVFGIDGEPPLASIGPDTVVCMRLVARDG